MPLHIYDSQKQAESIQKKKNFRIHSLNNHKKALTLKNDEVYT